MEPDRLDRAEDEFIDEYLARQTKTPPVHELLHGASNANDLMSDTFGNIVGPR